MDSQTQITEFIRSKSFIAIVILLGGWFGGEPAAKYLAGLDQQTTNMILNLLVTGVAAIFAWAKASQIQTKAKLENRVVDVRVEKQDIEQELADTKRALSAAQKEVDSLKKSPPPRKTKTKNPLE